MLACMAFPIENMLAGSNIIPWGAGNNTLIEGKFVRDEPSEFHPLVPGENCPTKCPLILH